MTRTFSIKKTLTNAFPLVNGKKMMNNENISSTGYGKYFVQQYFCWKIKCILALLFLLLSSVSMRTYSQKIAEKSNLLYWATTTPNIAMEVSLSKRFSLDVSGGYNPWLFSQHVSFRHWLVQPEIRYWPCRVFEGHFWGIHGLGGRFNLQALPFFQMPHEYSYEGRFYGGGLAYGFHFPLGSKFGLELTVGAGYVRIEYDKYKCLECREKVAMGNYNYFGPTRLGVSVIYMLR